MLFLTSSLLVSHIEFIEYSGELKLSRSFKRRSSLAQKIRAAPLSAES